MADAIAPLLRIEIDQRQDLLETGDVIARLEKILALMKADRQAAGIAAIDAGMRMVGHRVGDDEPIRSRRTARWSARFGASMRRHDFITLFGGAALAMLGSPVISDIRAAPPAAPTDVHLARQRVTFRSDGLTLSGILYQPQGRGPFPALIWNHGSEKAPGASPQFDSVASIFVPAGYAVFAPIRRGHGYSTGRYIGDVIDQAQATEGFEAAHRMVVRLLESEQLDDQLAGLAYVKQLPFVDSSRLAVAGCSYGGIQTLLGAEKRVGYKAAISISPAALSWTHNTFLQKRLIQSLQDINIPVLLLQPARDASLEPSRILGAEAARLGTPLTTKVYPDTGPEDERGHCFGGAKGMHVWAQDAKAFLAANVR